MSVSPKNTGIGCLVVLVTAIVGYVVVGSTGGALVGMLVGAGLAGLVSKLIENAVNGGLASPTGFEPVSPP